MSKVICDVCGTTYPETASACPICGCAKNTTEQTGADTAQYEESGSYTYVKGGRFSKSNVRRRNKKGKSSIASQHADRESTNKGLVVVVLLLLIAIIAVLGYIGVRFLFPKTEPKPENPGISQSTESTPVGSTNSGDPANVPCTGIKLSSTTIELSEAGMSWLLSVEAEPLNTTDKVTFASSNEQVAIVSDAGTITAIGGGEAVITVTCGEIKAECKIVCTFDPVGPTTQPTEPEVTVPEGFELKLTTTEFTMSEKYPNPVKIYRETNGVKATDITWTVDNPEIAAVDEKGVVSAVGKGNTVVRGTLGDQTVSCKVVVAFTPKNPSEEKYKISSKDVTIEVGETFSLTLNDKDGVKMDVQWVASEEGFVTIDGSRITGVAAGENGKLKKIEISGIYEEVTYTCTVYIKEAD